MSIGKKFLGPLFQSKNWKSPLFGFGLVGSPLEILSEKFFATNEKGAKHAICLLKKKIFGTPFFVKKLEKSPFRYLNCQTVFLQNFFFWGGRGRVRWAQMGPANEKRGSGQKSPILVHFFSDLARKGLTRKKCTTDVQCFTVLQSQNIRDQSALYIVLY